MVANDKTPTDRNQAGGPAKAIMIKIRVLRPVFLSAERAEAGAEVFVSPVDAASAVASGRCEYVNPDDLAVVNQALIDELSKFKGPSGNQWLNHWVKGF